MKTLIQTTANPKRRVWFDPVLLVPTPAQNSLIIAFGLITGIASGASISADEILPIWGWLTLTASLAMAAIILLIRGPAVIGMMLKMAALILLGITLTAGSHQASPSAGPPLSQSTNINIQGKVSMAEVMRGDRQRIRLSSMPGHDWPISPDHDLRLITPHKSEPLRPGDIIHLRGRINPPLPQLLPDSFDFTAHAHRLGYGATGFVDDYTILDHGKVGLPEYLRFHIQTRLFKHLDYDHAAIASALLVGLRGGLTPTIQENFRASGLSHLLAISGLHMALFWGSVLFLIRAGLACFPHFSSRYPSLKLAVIAALPFGVFYLIISGMPVSAVRAFMMLGLFMLAILLTRRGITLHHVALAAIVILVTEPAQLFQPAFQMSFAAVFALVAGWMAITARQWDVKLPRLLRYGGGIMIGSILAGTVTAPFVLHHFGVTTIWSILANLIGMPLMAFVIMPFGALSLILMPLGLDAYPLYLMGAGITLLLTCADYVAGLPFSVISALPPDKMVLYLYTLGLLLTVILGGRLRYLAIAILISSGLLWSQSDRPVAAMTILHHRTLAAVTDGISVYYSRKSATAFEMSIIVRPFGLNRRSYIGTAPSHPHSFELVRSSSDLNVAMVWRKTQLDDACTNADLIFVMRDIRRNPCEYKTITLSDIRSNGGVLVYHDGGRNDKGIRLHFTNGRKIGLLALARTRTQ